MKKQLKFGHTVCWELLKERRKKYKNRWPVGVLIKNKSSWIYSGKNLLKRFFRHRC
jgi:hypothetical protein